MTVYVDPLMAHGWVLRGNRVDSCHLFTDQLDLRHLHVVAAASGCKKEWLQDGGSTPHYDLTSARRKRAIDAGAVPVDRRTAVGIWRLRRKVAAAQEQMLEGESTTLDWVASQMREAMGPGGTVGCECGMRLTVPKLFRCYYCGAFLCNPCAELHFGQTRAAYAAERAAKVIAEA